jgi:uncharacterized protein (TIGR02453 family)
MGSRATSAAQPAQKTAKFAGWPKDLYDFYDGLEEENSREFFRAHKEQYEQCVRGPMAEFVAANQAEFGPGHIFRPNRDVRSAADKRPYKDYCGAVVHQDGGPIYYVQVNAGGLMAAAGYYMMQSDQIARYRAAVADDTTGPELADIVACLRRDGFEVDSVDLKRVPTPYPKDHPRADLLRHKSVTMARSWRQPVWLSTARAGTEIVKTWRASRPLNAWLVAHVGPSQESAKTRPR